jgi:hypothetical protein
VACHQAPLGTSPCDGGEVGAEDHQPWHPRQRDGVGDEARRRDELGLEEGACRAGRPLPVVRSDGLDDGVGAVEDPSQVSGGRKGHVEPGLGIRGVLTALRTPAGHAHDAVATVEEGLDDRVSELAGGPDDDDPHAGEPMPRRGRGVCPSGQAGPRLAM